MTRKLTLIALLVALAAPPVHADGGGQDPPYSPKGGGSTTPLVGSELLLDAVALLVQVFVL